MKKVSIIILILLISTISYTQTTYFVDASNGNDNNNGTSGATPWKSIDRVNDESFQPGDIILFKRGETWTDERLEVEGYSGTSTNLITFGAYPDNSEPYPIITTITEH